MSPSPVQVLVTSSPIPTILDGELLSLDGDTLRIRCDTPIDPRMSVVVVPELTSERIVAKVEDSTNGVITLTVRLSRPPERREWPRMIGSVPLRWKVASGAEEIRSWLAGEATSDEGWFQPDSLMSFSVTGLAFETREDVDAGTQLLLEISVGHNPVRWRCTGQVVRVLPPLQADGEGIRLAIQLEDVPGGASEALSELTLELQSAMM